MLVDPGDVVIFDWANAAASAVVKDVDLIGSEPAEFFFIDWMRASFRAAVEPIGCDPEAVSDTEDEEEEEEEDEAADPERDKPGGVTKEVSLGEKEVVRDESCPSVLTARDWEEKEGEVVVLLSNFLFRRSCNALGTCVTPGRRS